MTIKHMIEHIYNFKGIRLKAKNVTFYIIEPPLIYLLFSLLHAHAIGRT